MTPKLRCVLLVDDNHFTNLFNEKMIRNVDPSVKINVAENGEQALDYLTNAVNIGGDDCPNPDLIFLDINMPRMNGWEFLEEYRKRKLNELNRVIIIMLTTSPNPDEKVKAGLVPEISGYVKKPLTPESLQDVLQKYFSS